MTRKYQYASLPTAVQGRIMNAKGLWVLHPEDDNPEPRIWVRDSQNKINLPHLDKAHRIFDLLCASRPSSSISLSRQSIINLWSNGIPNEPLIELLEHGLKEEVQPLMDWHRPNAMVHLWHAINHSGHVSGARSQRLAAGFGRVLGLQANDWGHEDVGMAEANRGQVEETRDVVQSGRNEYSGGMFVPFGCGVGS